MTINSRDVLQQEWFYRGEGNANLVISLPDSGKILRLRKAQPPKTILEWFVSWIIKIFNWNYKRQYQHDLQDLKFYNLVMRKLLGEVFVCDAQLVHVSRKNIERLDEELMACRPDYRKRKRLQFSTGTLFTDYALMPKSWEGEHFGGNTFAVEIKPKQGFVAASVSGSKCQFCSNQLLKLKRGQIAKITSYCPLDLFSGDRERMVGAVRALVRNPQNNLKIFKNGVYHYGENGPVSAFYDLLADLFAEADVSDDLLDQFCNLIQEALTRKLEKAKDCDHNCVSYSKHFSVADSRMQCSYTESNLPEGCVLEKILAVQKLERLGLDNYKIIFEQIKPCNKIDDYVGDLLREVNCDMFKCPKCVIVKHVNRCLELLESKSTKIEASSSNLLPYLISAVTKDCSLMLTYRRIATVNKHVLPEEFIVKAKKWDFAVSVGIFDLYPKSMFTITKHIKRNANILNIRDRHKC